MKPVCCLCGFGKWHRNVVVIKVKGKDRVICFDCKPLFKRAQRLLK